MNGKSLAAGIMMAIVIPLTACGGGSTPAPPTNGGTQQSVAAATPTADVGLGSTLSSKDADVLACTDLQKAAAAFLANKNQDTLDAFEAALTDRPGAAMSPSLDSAFSALSDDVENEMMGDSSPATMQSDEDAVAAGCARVGVQMPAGFTD
jgi:hypothetical protein